MREFYEPQHPAEIVAHAYRVHPSLLCNALLDTATRHTELAAMTAYDDVARVCRDIAGICLDAATHINEGEGPALLAMLARPDPALLITRAAGRLLCLPAAAVADALANEVS